MSKNAMWIMASIGAGIVGFFLGPKLLSGFSPSTVLMLAAIFFMALIGYIIWALSNNRGAKKADEAQQVHAKAMKASDGKARIYITRRGFVASMQGVDVVIAGIAKGQIKSGQMLMAEVSPGSYSISVNAAKASLAKGADMDVPVVDGEVVVLAVAFEMGALKGTLLLDRCDDQQARNNVAHNKLMLWEDGGS